MTDRLHAIWALVCPCANVTQTEWCYNYHDPTTSYALNHTSYPDQIEQARFIKSYVSHYSGLKGPPSTSTTPHLGPTSTSKSYFEPPTPTLPPFLLNTSDSSMSIFTLDSNPRTPKSYPADADPMSRSEVDESMANDALEQETKRLMQETRLWRAANSAQWVAWGIVQAKLPGALAQEIELEEASKNVTESGRPALTPHQKANPENGLIDGDHEHSVVQPAEYLEKEIKEDNHREVTEQSNAANQLEEVDDGEDEFDYLAYAHDRALFFWGDVLQAGVIGEDEVPEALRLRAKRVVY
jgi:choline kinase